MRRIYTLLLWLAVPVATLVVWWRGLRNRAYWQGWRERFGFGYLSTAPCIWVHAVSVGEVQAATVLLRALQNAQPELRLLLTCATPTGRNQARQNFPVGAEIRYAPYDMPGVVRRVLAAARPRLLIILETELWPNLLHECAQAGVPVLLASARITERTVRGIGRWPGLLSAAALANLHVAAQSAEDAERYLRLGVSRSAQRVCGNIKFDRELEPAQMQRGAQLRQRYAGGRAMWVAGSTHEGEEIAILDAHEVLCQQTGSALLVLAPRHPQRFEAVAQLLTGRGVSYLRRSNDRLNHEAGPAGRGNVGEVAVLLLDTLGELNDFYAAADLAFVGGSLVPVGGHNLLEPVALGIATVTGPHQFNTPDIARALAERGALCTVQNATELRLAVLRLMQHREAREQLVTAGNATVSANRGALACVLVMVTELLRASRPVQPRAWQQDR
jgi:3-deoxy-D-manno-octulosonic-acid transferase